MLGLVHGKAEYFESYFMTTLKKFHKTMGKKSNSQKQTKHPISTQQFRDSRIAMISFLAELAVEQYLDELERFRKTKLSGLGQTHNWNRTSKQENGSS